MARFLFWADLHDEFWQGLTWPADTGPIDAVLLAGDISTKGRHVDRMLDIFRHFQVPVRMVRGNHEYYGSVMEDLIEEEASRIAELRASGVDIAVLDADAEIIAGTRVIGASLWTDLDLYPGSTALVRECMNDFRMIRRRREDSMHPTDFTIADWLELHWRDREFVFKTLREPFEGDTIVLTHHMPLAELIHPLRRHGDRQSVLTNGGFASDLAPLIRPHDIRVWLCGHSHDNRSVTLEGFHDDIPFVTNSRGYPGEGATFDPGLVIETGNRVEPVMVPDMSPS
jgi:Icc-related predicted phosphoesterase